MAAADDRSAGPAPANPAAAPGSSGPGEHGYGGAATVGDEGAAAGAESFDDPFGRPEPGDDEGQAASRPPDPEERPR